MRAVPRYPKDEFTGCMACELMHKDEQYARGWVKLYGNENQDIGAEVAQYALDLQKLRHAHEERHGRRA